MYCVFGVSPFSPNISAGRTLMWKLCTDALKATQLPFLTKNIFLCKCGKEFRAVEPFIFLKGWSALVQCCAATPEMPAPHSHCAAQMGIEHFCEEGIQGDVSKGLVKTGSSHMTAAMMFGFQEKCCVMSLKKLNFSNGWIRLIIIRLVWLCCSLGINISSVLKTHQR